MHWIRSDIPSIAEARRGGAAARAIALEKAGTASADLRLFATTFVGGFVFVSLLIA